jgi:hypothetical protein
MKNEIATDVLESASYTLDETMNSVLYAQALFEVVVAVSLAHILNMFHPLQIMVFQSMLSLQYPANAIFLTYSVSKIINLDILDPELLSELLLGHSIEDVVSADP